MTIRPSFPPPFAPSSVTLAGILLFQYKANTSPFGESVFSPPLSRHPCQRRLSPEVKTCRLITARIKMTTRVFYNGSRSSGFESAKLRGVRGILGCFPSRPGPVFSLRSHTACLTLLHRYVNIRTAISLISPPVGKIYTGVFVRRVEVIDRPRPSRLALFLFRVPIRFGCKCRTDGEGCGGYQNVYGWK